MTTSCKILESKQSDKFLFMKVQFTESSFFGLFSCNNVYWIYTKLDQFGEEINGYWKFKDTHKHVFARYGSYIESFLSKEAERFTKSHRELVSCVENQFLIAE